MIASSMLSGDTSSSLTHFLPGTWECEEGRGVDLFQGGNLSWREAKPEVFYLLALGSLLPESIISEFNNVLLEITLGS